MNTQHRDVIPLPPSAGSVLRNRHTKIVHPILRRDPNGDVVLWAQSGRFRVTISDMQDHWEAVEGCPVCGGTGKVWNMPDDREEACKVCSPNVEVMREDNNE